MARSSISRHVGPFAKKTGTFEFITGAVAPPGTTDPIEFDEEIVLELATAGQVHTSCPNMVTTTPISASCSTPLTADVVGVTVNIHGAEPVRCLVFFEPRLEFAP